jgi:AAA+ ATPase superfamily predicted ATPase
MRFVDRIEELDRLDRLATGDHGGLAVIYGRRRIGKTRLLLEWSERRGGLYTVADQSAPEIQRRYVAEAIAQRLPGFADVDYRDWRGLLDRLAREADAGGFRGPLIFDELPYLVLSSPELPSILQRWLDHQAKEARLAIAVAGSSQRMMQGLVLAGDAPLYGRAREILQVSALAPEHLGEVFAPAGSRELVEIYTAWGGVPRYWELAADLDGGLRSRIEALVLDPLGPLHREPDRLLIEELPPAVETRPVLDAIGAGAHRVSEIAGRIGRAATSLWRPLDRLIGMGLVRREVPFGESEKKSRRSLYKIDDPFSRFWFRVVAPHRGQLAAGTVDTRLAILDRFWDPLVAQAWEELCRRQIPRLDGRTPLGAIGPWGPAARWWKGNLPEWDLVAESIDGERLLLGEAKWSAGGLDAGGLDRARRDLASRPPPVLPPRYANRRTVRALFVPELADGERGTLDRSGPLVVTAAELLGLPEAGWARPAPRRPGRRAGRSPAR